MAANNDFFVNFDSNATVWARKLEGQLQPARKVIVDFQRALYGLENKANDTGARAQAALAKQAAAQGSGSGGSGGRGRSSGIELDILDSALKSASAEAQELSHQLVVAKTAIDVTAKSIASIPGKLQASFKSITKSLSNIAEQAGGGNGRHFLPEQPNKYVAAGTLGAVQHGSDQAQVLAAVRKAVAGGPLGGSTALGARTSAPAHIANVSTIAQDRANADRIIAAIQFQTRTLAARLNDPRPPSGPTAAPAAVRPPANPVSGPAKAEAAAPAVAEKAVDPRTQAIETARIRGQQQLQKADDRIAEMQKKFGDKLNPAQQAILKELHDFRAELAKEIAADRRALEQLSKAELKKQNKEEFKAQQAAKPTITDTELAANQRDERLLASPADPKFLDQVGRGKDQYSGSELEQIAQAFERRGIPVPRNTRTKVGDLAKTLVGSSKEYSQLYPDGDPSLITDRRNANVVKTTEIPQSVTDLIGTINESVVQARRQAIDTVRANRSSGGQKIGPDELGTIDRGPNTRGRREYGAAISTAASPLSRAGTPQDVIDSYRLLQANPASQKANARRNAANPNFNPYDASLTKGIKVGNTQAEKDLADSTFAEIRNLRQATTKMDALGKKYLQLRDAFRESENYADKALATLKVDPNNKGAERGLHDVRADQDRINKLIAEIPKADRDTFDQPGYREGLALREEAPIGDAAGRRLVTGGDFVGPLTQEDSQRAAAASKLTARQAYEARAESASRKETLNDYRLLHTALVETAVGFKSLFGSKTATTRNLPNAGFTATGDITRSDGRISAEDQLELTRSQKALAAAQTRTLGLRTKERRSAGSVDPEEMAKAEQALDNLAERFSNNLQKIFGTSLPTRTYTGREPITPELKASEARRQEKRDALEELRVAKPKLDAKGKAEQSALALENAEKQLATAMTKQAKLLARIEKEEKEFEDALSKLSKADRAQVREAQKLIAKTQKQIDALDRNFATQVPLGGVRTMDPDSRATFQTSTSEKTNEPRVIGTGSTDTAALLKQKADLQELQQAAAALILGKTQKIIPSGAQTGGGTRVNQDDQLAAAGLEKEIEGLQARIEKLRKESGLAAKAVEKETESKKKAKAAKNPESTPAAKAVGAKNEELAELRRERAAVRKEGEYTRKQVSDLRKARDAAVVSPASERSSRAVVTRYTNSGATDKAEAAQAKLNARLEAATKAEEAYATALARKNRITELSSKIEKIQQAGGGGKGGGGKTPTANGGAGGGFERGANSILNKILAELKQVNAKLATGIKTTVQNDVKVKATTTAAKPADGTEPKAPSVRRGTAYERQPGFIGPVRAENVTGREDAIKAERKKQELKRQREINTAHAEALPINQKIVADIAKTEQELRDEERRVNDVNNAMARLSQTTLREVETLRQMTAQIKAAKSEEERQSAQRKASLQQVRVADAIGTDLKAQQVKAGGRRDATRLVLNDAGPQLGAGELDSVLSSARGARGFREVGESSGKEMGEGALDGFARIFGGNTSFLTRVMNTVGTFVVRNFAAGFVFGITNAFQQVIDQAIQAEATFVRVRATLESTGKDLGGVRQGLQSVASDYGTQLNDVYQTAAGLTGIFDNSEDLVAGTRVVSQLQTISGGALNASEATGVLASTLSAFGSQPGVDLSNKILPGGIEGVEKVADVLTSIQNNLGVNIETSAEGVSRMAGLAREMKLSFEQTAVFTGQIAKLTNQTGAGAGEQFSRILTVLQSGRGRGAVNQALNSIGGDDGRNAAAQYSQALSQGDYGQGIEVLLQNWDKLSDAQKSNLTISIAGQRNAASFNALFNNSAKTLDALAKAENTSGEAADRMGEIMQTLNNRLARLGTEAQVLATNLIQTGLLNFLGLVLIISNNVLGAVNKILNAFNKFADGNPFLAFLRDMIGLLLGAGLALKAFKGAFSGIGANIAKRRAANAAEQGIIPPVIPRATAANPLPRLDRNGYPAALGYQGAYRTPSTTGVTTGRLPGTGAPLVRGVQNTFDRTVGSGLRGASAGLTRLSASLTPLHTEVSTTRRALSGFAQGLNSLAIGPLASLATGAGRLGNGGGLSGGLGRISGGFNQRAVDRAREAQALRNTARLQDQLGGLPGARPRPESPGQASLFDRTRGPARGPGGLSGDSSASLLRQARTQELLGRASATAANITGRLSSGLERVAESGGLADGAMLALAVSIGLALASWSKSQKVAQEVDKGYKASFGKNKGKSETEIAAEYVGKNNAYYAPRLEEAMNQANRSGFLNQLKSGAGGFGRYLTKGGPLNPTLTMEDAIYSDQGLEKRAGGGSQTYGLSRAQKLIDQARAEVDKLDKDPKSTGDQVRKVQEKYAASAQKLADEAVANGDLSEEQKQAFLANLELANDAIGDNVAAVSAQLDGSKSALALTAEQVTKLGDLASAATSIQGLQGQKGVDFSGILGAFAEDTGVTQDNGQKLNRIIGRITDPDSDPVDIAIANKRLLKESIIQLNAQRDAKLKAGLQDDADAIKGQLLQTMQQYAQAEEAVVDSIIANGQLLADQATNQGKYGRALKVTENALRRAATQYEKDAPKELPRQETPSFGDFIDPVGARKDRQEENRANKDRRAKHQAKLNAAFQTLIANQIAATLGDLQLQISQAADAGLRAQLQAQYDAAVASGYAQLDQGKGAFGISDGTAAQFGPDAVAPKDLISTKSTANQSALSNAQTQRDAANTARQNAAQIKAAQIGVVSAYAEARGDQVAAAQAQVLAAKAAIAAGQADLAAAMTMAAGAQRDQAVAQAKVAILSGQAQLISASAGVAQAQSDLVQSQFQVAIALADAAGRTVDSARKSLAAARAALGAAIKKSGGKATAEVNAAKAQAIQAEAALRDAKLQDSLDTIDFNLQMGKITQASAINALKEILKTQDLTKAQRRQLLLQIKGMKDELASSQFNFGNIKLPTPYEMRRYAQQQLLDMTGAGKPGNLGTGAANARVISPFAGAGGPGATGGSVSNSSVTNQTTIQINGADVAKVRKVVEDVVGRPSRTTTTAPRRRI